MSEKTVKRLRRVLKRNQKRIIRQYLAELKKAKFKEKLKWCFELLIK